MEIKTIRCSCCNKILKISDIIILNNKALCSNCYSVVETNKEIVKYIEEIKSSIKEER